VATKIKLMRLGKMRAPYYRVVVADARTKRDGRAIEVIGKYHPKEHPSFIEVNSERAQYWLSVGAQPTEAVTAILKVTGDWQKFKGEPAPPPMLVAEPKPNRKQVFEAAALEAGAEKAAAEFAPKETSKPAKAEKAAKAEVDEAPAADADAPAAEAVADEAPAAEAVADEAPAAEAAADDAPAADAAADESPAETGETEA
jgi:small subunit ribosomal protein S16